MTEIEWRPFAGGVEFRSMETETGTKPVLSGIAIKYGARSKDLGGFRERIMPGAASKLLKESDVMAFEEHRADRYLGRTGNATLRLIDSKEALRYEVDLPDTAVGREVAALAARGDYRGSSFGFRAQNESWAKDEDGLPLRTITAFRALRDVGPTVAPAYDDSPAETALRHLAEERQLELRSVLEAARAGKLGLLLDSGEVVEEIPPATETSTATETDEVTDSGLIIQRRIPLHWLL